MLKKAGPFDPDARSGLRLARPPRGLGVTPPASPGYGQGWATPRGAGSLQQHELDARTMPCSRRVLIKRGTLYVRRNENLMAVKCVSWIFVIIMVLFLETYTRCILILICITR